MIKQLDRDFLVLQKMLSLNDRFSINKQAKLIKNIASQGLVGLLKLFDLLIDRQLKNYHKLNYIDGMLLQQLYVSHLPEAKQRLNKYLYVNSLKSYSLVNYALLEKSLLLCNFKDADHLTRIYLCHLAGLNVNDYGKRHWLYFTDIVSLASEDLRIIDDLWRIYSQERFGFSIQRSIWLSKKCDWEKLWSTIGWKKQNILVRYPQEFTWDISAPLGHLPLLNQLRGVQVLSFLFSHSTWNIYNSK